MNRRDFVRSAGGTTAVLGAGAAATSTAAAQEGGEEQPDFGGWLSGVDGGYEDLRGESEITVQVGAEGNGGAFAFAPAGVWVDTGTTIRFEWTGDGGGHNVVAQEGPASLDSGDPVAEAGVNYEYTVEDADAGITKYVCIPHQNLNMQGAIAVGEDVPTVSTGGEGGGNVPSVPDTAKTLGVATFIAMTATLGLAYFFLKYGGDYEEPDV